MQYPQGLIQCLINSVGSVLKSCEVKEVKPMSGGMLNENGGDMFSASLGFAGSLQGAIIICAREVALTSTNPQRAMQEGPLTKADNSDWIGEIANQVVGSLKREVSRYGVTFNLATPTVVHGQDLSIGLQAKAQPNVFLFEADGHQWKIYFNCEIAADAAFDKPKADAEVHKSGGDSFLF